MSEPAPPRSAFVYMLECADSTLYTGWTYNPLARLRRHQAGRGARYTRVRLPVRLVYTETLPDKIQAQKREYALKQLDRAAKLRLVAGWQADSEPSP